MGRVAEQGGDVRPQACGLYLPGHDVHWIQAIHAAADKEHPPQSGRLVGVSDDGTLEVAVAPALRVLWHHDPGRVAEAAARNDGAVALRPSWGLLYTESDAGRACFCVVGAAEEHQPCPETAPGGDPVERLQHAGGFLLPAGEILRWVTPDGRQGAGGGGTPSDA